MELFASKGHLEDEQGTGSACHGGSITVTPQLPPARPQQGLRKCSHWTVRAGGTPEALGTKVPSSQEGLGPAGAGVPAWLPPSPAPVDALPGRDPATSAYSDPTHPTSSEGLSCPCPARGPWPPPWPPPPLGKTHQVARQPGREPVRTVPALRRRRPLAPCAPRAVSRLGQWGVPASGSPPVRAEVLPGLHHAQGWAAWASSPGQETEVTVLTVSPRGPGPTGAR